MKFAEKLEIATWAIHALPNLVRTLGEVQPATALQPAHATWEVGNLTVGFGAGFLLLPHDSALSSLIDVWLNSSQPKSRTRKVFSVSWMPTKPWEPPRIVALRNGDWLHTLRCAVDMHRSTAPSTATSLRRP